MTKDNGKPKNSGTEIGAREAILSDIRSALRNATEHAPASSIPRNYRQYGRQNRAECIDLFVDRLADYDAAVLQVESEAELREAIASSLRASSEQRIVVAAAFPREWLPGGLQVVDNGLANAELEGVEAVITTCEVAVASTGTILLRHGAAQGRRAITLLPDHHICIVRCDQVVELLPEALGKLDPVDTAPITTISGPSATSDIEMTRIRGVHGPRRLSVILYGPLRSGLLA